MPHFISETTLSRNKLACQMFVRLENYYYVCTHPLVFFLCIYGGSRIWTCPFSVWPAYAEIDLSDWKLSF